MNTFEQVKIKLNTRLSDDKIFFNRAWLVSNCSKTKCKSISTYLTNLLDAKYISRIELGIYQMLKHIPENLTVTQLRNEKHEIQD